MAIELNEILRIDDTTTLQDFRNKIRELREEISRLKLEGKDYTEQAEKISVVQGHLSEVMNASKKYTTDAEGSFNALNARLRQLKEEWKATGDEARRAALGEEIKKVKGQMNTMNESIGNYQHNVGNYTNSIVDAFKQMGISFGGTSAKFASMAGILTGGLSKLGGAFKSLWGVLKANPIGIVLAAVGALVGAFSKLRQAIRNNEESELRFHQALAAFQPIKDKFTNWLDEAGQGFVNFTEAVADAWVWLRKTYAAYTDYMGYTTGRKERVEAEQAFAKEVGAAEAKLIQLTRETKKLNATDEVTLTQARELASMTNDRAKQVEYLTAAKEAQQRINERNIKLAEEEYDLLKKQTSTTNNSIEVNNKLNDAEVKVIQTRANGNLALVRLNRQITNSSATLSKHKEAVDEDAKALERMREASLRAAEAEAQRAQEVYEESLEALKSETEKEEEEYQRRRQLLMDHNLSTEALDAEHHRKEVEMLTARYDAEYKAEEAKVDFEYQMQERRNALARKEEGGGDTEGGSGIERAMREAELADEEMERFRTYTEEKIRLNELQMLSFEEGSEEWTAIDQENTQLRMEMAEKEFAAKQKHDKAEKKLIQARQDAYRAMAMGTAGILKDLSSAMGESTKMGKGFAIAAATIDTIASAVAGFRAGMNQWADAGPLAFMAPIQAAINATAALVAGYAQVQKIASVDTSGNAQASGGGATALAIPNIEGLSSPIDYTRQVTTETEREQMNQDNRVYILESDIQQSNNRVRVREEETTF